MPNDLEIVFPNIVKNKKNDAIVHLLFTLKNQSYNVTLTPNHGLLSRDFLLTQRGDNDVTDHVTLDKRWCYYSSTEEDVKAAVNICHGEVVSHLQSIRAYKHAH